jgi:hypothetical protein
MCAASMVIDYGRQYIHMNDWTIPTYNEFTEILRRVNELDKKLNQPECHDPEKAKWMKEVEERLSTLEGAENLRKYDEVFPA